MKASKYETLPSPVADDLLKIAAVLRRARVARGESQADLARRIGVAERTLREAEKGAPSVSAGTLFSLLWAVGHGGIGADLKRKMDAAMDSPMNSRARRKSADRLMDDF